MNAADVVVLLVLLTVFAEGVERRNFKTCNDSGFCRRHRALQAGRSPYVAVLDSLRIEDDGTIRLLLVNTVTGVRLKLAVSTYGNSVVRLHVTELDSIRDRYEVPPGDVVLSILDQVKPKVDSRDEHGLTVTAGRVTVAIQANPFSVEFAIDNKPLISINARGLMKFEHYRQKPAMTTAAGTQNATQGTAIDDPDAVDDDSDVADDDYDEQQVVAASQPAGESVPETRTGSGISMPGMVDAAPLVEAATSADEAQEAAAHEPLPLPEEAERQSDRGEHDEEHGAWEESFKSITDSKPHGPASVGADISFVGFEHVYGIPEHADSFALRSTSDTDPYRLYNLDVFEYELNNPMALYGSVPVMFAHSESNSVGVFWQNPSETWIDISRDVADGTTFPRLAPLFRDRTAPKVDTHWFFESGVIDVFVMLGPTPSDVSFQYSLLTGATPLPPLFALAYHQSRWNYNDEADVHSVHEHFDKHDIPMDVIWLDIEHTDGKKYFTWDSAKFPNPEEMIHNLTAKGRRLVTIIDPHIKRDDTYNLHNEASELGFYVKDKDGTKDFEGWCWPGLSSYLDFTNPKVRAYWASKFSLSQYQGSTLELFTWNDMNEPAVFNGPELTMHKDARHHEGWEHREVHNIYGYYQQMASAKGQVERSHGTQRPFVLSRAFFAGSQRWGAVWTGDNTGDWGHLKISIPMLLSMNLVGITLCGADVGGFFRNGEPELITRWYQAAAYQPFFRAHAHMDTRRREPWLLPEHNMRLIRAAIRDRYSLLSYWYTLFFHGEREGGPIMRPIWYDFPAAKEFYTEQEQYMIGPALLVKPVTDAGAAGVSVYFPQHGLVWYDVDNYAQYLGGTTEYVPTPLDKIPVYQRGGYIIPRRNRIRRSSTLTKNDPFTLVVALDAQGAAQGELYLDDYTSYQYRLGRFVHRRFTFNQTRLENREVVKTQFATAAWVEEVVVLGLQYRPLLAVLESSGTSRNLDSHYDASTKVLRIRKPAVSIAERWVINLK